MNYKLEVFKKASLCRNFELYTSKFIKTGDIYIPTYVSTGQEFIAASLSILCEKKKIIRLQDKSGKSYDNITVDDVNDGAQMKATCINWSQKMKYHDMLDLGIMTSEYKE